MSARTPSFHHYHYRCLGAQIGELKKHQKHGEFHQKVLLMVQKSGEPVEFRGLSHYLSKALTPSQVVFSPDFFNHQQYQWPIHTVDG